MNNQFRNKNYMLVKVRYNIGTKGGYVYAIKKKLKPETGSLVVVHVGEGKPTIDNMKVAEVTATSDNLKHIPNDYEIKEVLELITV